ncbi:hypothetical protein AWB74_06214 [Caballeronia arvi]|uniref:Uncharacterized protein n=1 Tax=Caballeronia arvi TaxID=1777135 RepID=A0A158KNF4_9BURK|nr:hypothetical protein AWB74_06214 [Caballeronia arvi]
MDQREEWRSLYSVVCPRCESLSQADDLPCPYCGADRHGAVLTRADASLLEIDEAVRAMVRAASARVLDDSSDGSNGSGAAPQEVGTGSWLLSSRAPLLERNTLLAVMAVGLCGILGSYGWVRNALNDGVGGSKTEAVSAVGNVREPASPVAQLGSAKTTGIVDNKESIPLAQDHFLAMVRPMNRAAFMLHGVSPLPPCIVTALPASVFEARWCDATALTRSGVEARGVNAWAGTIVLRTAEKTLRDTTRASRPPESSRTTSTRHRTSYADPRVDNRAAHAKSAQQPARHVAGTTKTHAEMRMPQHAAPLRKKTEVSHVERPNGVPLLVEPATTSSGNRRSSATPDRFDGPLQAGNRGPTVRPSPINTGRGDAH